MPPSRDPAREVDGRFRSAWGVFGQHRDVCGQHKESFGQRRDVFGQLKAKNAMHEELERLRSALVQCPYLAMNTHKNRTNGSNTAYGISPIGPLVFNTPLSRDGDMPRKI